ncbi:FG-GAP repeat domain-containing protein [Endothiovibrio diazotrophicus]
MERLSPRARLLTMLLLPLATLSSPRAADAAQPPHFDARRYEVGRDPYHAVAGDFNEDGHADLITANRPANNLSLLLGDGNGGFASTATLAVDGGVYALAGADLDRDGHLDLAVTDAYSNVVRVYLGDGSGGFTLTSRLTTGSMPVDIAAADLDGDGWLDLVTADNQSADLSLLLNDRAGGFRPATFLATESGSENVVVADLDGDGYPELLTTNKHDYVTVRRGLGGGSFSEPTDYTTYPSAYDMRVGEFTGDGHPDLLVASWGSPGHGVALLAGDGSGGFAAPSLVSAEFLGRIEVADCDGDGRLDLVAGRGVMLGDGAGGFATLSPLLLSPREGYQAEMLRHLPVDLNGDGYPDLASISRLYDSVSVILNRAAVDLPPFSPTAYPIDGTALAMAGGDLNGDGVTDLVVGHQGTDGAEDAAGSVTLLLSDGSGGFTSGGPLTVGNQPQGVALADLDRDGHLDLVTANAGSDDLSLLLGNGDGTFATATTLAAGERPGQIAVADLNGDTFPDLAVLDFGSEAVTRLLGDGRGGFTAAGQTSVGAQPKRMLVSDLDGDGYPELITSTERHYDLEIRHNDGGEFTAEATRFSVAERITDMATADFDGDGRVDLAVTFDTYDPDQERGLMVWRGLGDGSFADPTAFPSVGITSALYVADLNGDGAPDLLLSTAEQAKLSLLLNDGDGNFGEPLDLRQGGSHTAVVVADVNGDALTDLAVLGDEAVYPLIQRAADGSGDGDTPPDGGDDGCPRATVSRNLLRLSLPLVRYRDLLGVQWLKLNLQLSAEGDEVRYRMTGLELLGEAPPAECALTTLSPALHMSISEVLFDTADGELPLAAELELVDDPDEVLFRVTGYRLRDAP